MGKISPISIKYIIHANIQLSSIAEKPDVIGAVFGQTEGLLGSDLELRELQKSGRIGRIDVILETKNGKSNGEIIVPSSMSKSETSLVAAALETIEKVGPCDSVIKVKDIEDVRASKRDFIMGRAKELLGALADTLPDSQEIKNEVSETVARSEMVPYGPEGLPAGPHIDDSTEIIVVEGRADVVNLLRYGIKNAIGLNGAKATKAIIDLSKNKTTTLFVDGDRGGELIIRNLSNLAEINFIAKAPDGKEVEELTMKEIHKALRSRVPFKPAAQTERRDMQRSNDRRQSTQTRRIGGRPRMERPYRSPSDDLKKDSKRLKQISEELVGTRGAFLLDKNMNILGKVPTKELVDTLDNMSEEIYIVIMDGPADAKLLKTADKKSVNYLVSDSKTGREGNTKLVNIKDL